MNITLLAKRGCGGKTHALTLLYHLANTNNGPKAKEWQGVSRLLRVAGINAVPAARVAVFVGTEFDAISGRGGNDGTPLRQTPWGEIAFQLGGADALAILTEHERQGVAPGGDVIRAFLPTNRPVLILMDELMNFVSRSRKSGIGGQLYDFLQSLSEEAHGRDNMVLAVSIPASELEMSAEAQSDYERFKKLLDRVGKAVIMSADSETSEIIRRRIFAPFRLILQLEKTGGAWKDWRASPGRKEQRQEQGWPLWGPTLPKGGVGWGTRRRGRDGRSKTKGWATRRVASAAWFALYWSFSTKIPPGPGLPVTLV